MINLACISNDASFELDEKLSTSINLDAFEPMVIAAKEAGVQRFIYASSSSVYGVSDAPDVTEDHPLVPLTLYNKYKGMCEPLLFKHTDDNFVGVDVPPGDRLRLRPALRLDLSVNILTNHAINNNKITVFGGAQMRPNLHIQDYVDACQAAAHGARREDRRRDLQLRLPEPEHHGSRASGEARGRGGVPREGADRHRHHAEQRQPLLPHQFRQDRARLGLQRRSTASRMRCATCAAPSAPARCQPA